MDRDIQDHGRDGDSSPENGNTDEDLGPGGELFVVDSGDLGLLDIASLVRAFWLEGEALLADADDEPVRLSVVREGKPNALANAACGYFCFHRGCVKRLSCSKGKVAARQSDDQQHCRKANDAGKCHPGDFLQ
jgi:hypothetical protein